MLQVIEYELAMEWGASCCQIPRCTGQSTSKHTIQDDHAVLDTWLIEKKNLNDNRKLLKQN